MTGQEGRDPIEDLQILRTEIKMYDEDLAKFPWKILANKMDVPEAAENLVMMQQRFPKIEILPISAKEGEGLEDLKRRLCEEVGRQPQDYSSGLKDSLED